jgi:hypothetical protein
MLTKEQVSRAYVFTYLIAAVLNGLGFRLQSLPQISWPRSFRVKPLVVSLSSTLPH